MSEEIITTPEAEELAEPTLVEKLQEAWSSLTPEVRHESFRELPRVDAEEFFLTLGASDQHDLLLEMSWPQRRLWMRLLAPDDAADLIQQFPFDDRERLLQLLDPSTRREVTALLAYSEDEAGGLMNTRFIRLRPDVPVDVAIRYIRAQAKQPIEIINYAYVLEHDQKLVGVVSFRDLLVAPPEKLVSEIMTVDVISFPEDMDQEEVSRQFAVHDMSAIPVVDEQGHMKGLITHDDVVDIVREEATEDIQKIGGMEAITDPYLDTSFLRMIKKRAGWLTVLFLGEMLTATAMGHFEKEIERAVVLALFIPLIISSGGNSGSQATSLIIRALALQELKLRDWWRVFVRELSTGLTLGLILGVIGLLRVALWPPVDSQDQYMKIAFTVSISLVGVVLWGSLAGSMLPFLMRRLGVDPATASGPFVATLVDVTGLILYFSVASFLLF